MRKILVFSMTRMGDIIQSVPFARRLRRKHPDAQIDLFVEKCFADVADFMPGIDNIIKVNLEDLLLCFDNEQGANLSRGIAYYNELVRSLQSKSYDEVWNLTHTKPFTVLSSLIGGEHAFGVTLDNSGLQTVNKSWLKYFYATNLARPWCQFNLVDIYANCIDGVDQDFGRSVRISPETYTNELPHELKVRSTEHRVAIHPGASQKAKTWPVAKYTELADRLVRRGIEVVLIGGPADRAIGQELSERINAINLIGKTSVKQLAAALESCDLLISNDSGPMHIAAAVGTQVIALTLGSALGSETAPYGAGHWVIEPRIDCFPCNADQPCKIQKCADRISVRDVLEILDHCLLKSNLSERLTQNSRIRLYQTRHSTESGHLELIRCGNHPEDERDRLNELFKNLWPVWLDRKSCKTVNVSKCDHKLCELAIRIVDSADQAENFCRNIALCQHDSDKHLEKLEQLSTELIRVDRELTDLLRSEKVLQSVLAYLMIEKSSVQGDSLNIQARKTADIYHELGRMLRVVIPGNRQIEQKKNLDREVCYENLA